MATSYVTESLMGPASARGSSYTYTYESHYDNPPEVEDEEDRYAVVEEGTTHQTHKVTRVTKVTTTRSVRQIPVGSPYADLYFDASGLPTPSPGVELGAPIDDLGIRLQKSEEGSRSAPPPAPPLGSRYVNMSEERDVPAAPTTPHVIGTSVGEVTLSWSAPLQKPGERGILGYQ
ncbi:Fibronectin type-III domain-containing protein, partial [Trichostrongylus colubriformis]